MVQTLTFAGHRGIAAAVDGQPLDRVLGHPGMVPHPFRRDEWRITARTLQGWVPRDLGLVREQWVPVGPSTASGGYGYTPVRPITRVLVTLPGGDRPEVLADDVDTLISYDCVPLLGCECGSGVGCAHESVAVTFERGKVHWTHGPLELIFTRTQYDRAIKDLLVLLGEAPRLISPSEWRDPTQTRVVAASDRADRA